MEVTSFAEIEAEFNDRVRRVIWCSMATVDSRGRPRSRIVHPLWDSTPVGYMTSRRETLKARHIAANPHVSFAYVSEAAKPVYVDCIASWIDDPAERQYVWDFIKSLPPPYGFDPATVYASIDHPNAGMLKLIPWRIEVATLPSETGVWHARSA